jgi:hypothetical protein
MDKPKKRSGITAKRAFNLQCKLVERADDLYSRAYWYCSTHEQIVESEQRKLWHSKEWARVPSYVHSYVEGYVAAKREELYRHHLYWMVWLDGKLVTSKEVDERTKEEHKLILDRCNADCQDYAEPAGYRSPWSRIDSEQSRHVWVDNAGNPLPDKPFDGKWKQ